MQDFLKVRHHNKPKIGLSGFKADIRPSGALSKTYWPGPEIKLIWQQKRQKIKPEFQRWACEGGPDPWRWRVPC